MTAVIPVPEALAEAEALCANLEALYNDCRVREQQIALSRAYWQARRIADALRDLAVAA